MDIFLGNGDDTFSASTSYSTGYGSWPGSIAVADFNNDTLLDIVVGNYQTNNVGIFFGINNGTFSEQRTYQTGDGPGLTSVAIGDFNNDGCLDVAVANTWTNTVGILLGNGNGIFSNQTTYSTITRSLPFSIAVGDFDKDSRLDIVVANKGADNIGVFFGYGNGTFAKQVIFSTVRASQPTSVVVGDFNNDGRLDIAVANSLSGSVGVLLGYVNGIFFSQNTYFTGYHASSVFVVVGDFNNDSRLDIAVCNQGSYNIGIFFGYTDESFLSLPSYSTGIASRPTYVAVEDFNNDTRLDIVVANYGTNNVMILLGSGYGTFTSEMTYATGNNSQPCWVAIGDLNNDSRLDIVIANSGSDNVGVLLGYGNGTFSSQISYSTGIKSQPSSVTIGDFNNDTRLDLAVANYGSNIVGLLFDYGNGSFASQIRFSAGFDSRPLALASGDVNNDNVSDIIIANNGYGTIQILLKPC
jgi:hypothetical protein